MILTAVRSGRVAVLVIPVMILVSAGQNVSRVSLSTSGTVT